MVIFFRIALAALAFAPSNILCQDLYLSGGAKSAALGNASVTFKDPWAFNNNVAGTAFLKDTTLSFNFENRYGISNLNSFDLLGVLPFKHLAIAFSLHKLGDKLYHEQSLALGGAHRIGNVSLGVKLNVIQIGADEAPTKYSIIAEFGGIAEITKTLFFGAHIYNLNQATMKVGANKKVLPVIMKAGLSYSPHPKINISIEAYKAALFKASCRVGLEYFIVKKLFIRSGIMTNPYVNYFGIGFQHLRFSLDYAFGFQNSLGAINYFSISYHFTNR